MPRMIVLVVVLLILVGALFFLSSLPRQQPTRVIEAPVTAPPGGNAH